MTKQEPKPKSCFDEDGRFKNNGIIYERVILTIPSNIVNIYRTQAINAGLDHSAAAELIENAVIQDFNAKVECINDESFKEMFSLKTVVSRHCKE